MAATGDRRSHPLDIDDDVDQPPMRLPSRCTTNYNGGPVEAFALGDTYDYRVHESLPAIPSTHPQFYEAQRLIKVTVEQISQLFHNGETGDAELNELIDDLRDMRRVLHGRPLKVGVVGDTGSGKSSFINAILGAPLAVEGDSGSSCTQIVTEYVNCGGLNGHYRAQIRFKDRKTINRDIKRHFMAYIKYRPQQARKKGKSTALSNDVRASIASDRDEDSACASDDESSHEADAFGSSKERARVNHGNMDANDNAEDNARNIEEGTEDQDDACPDDPNDDIDDNKSEYDSGDNSEDATEARASRREHHMTAEAYLMQLFGALLNLRNEEDLRELMLSIPAHRYPQEIARLQARIRKEISSNLRWGQRELVVTAVNLKNLLKTTRRYTETQPTGRLALWPVVDAATISLESPLLLQGLALADCPGLSDTNVERRRATQLHVSQCSILLIISPIDRILDSPSVQQYLDTYVPQVGIGNVILIPTKIDRIKHTPAGRGVAQKDIEALENLEGAVEAAKHRYRHAVGASRIEKKTLKRQKLQAEKVLRQNRIRIRNEVVISELQRQNEDQGGRSRKDLKVVPVSNEIHGLYMSGETEDVEPDLTIAEDGIAKVRSLLCTMARMKRLASTHAHIDSILRPKINQLEMAVSVSLNDRVKAVIDGIDRHKTLSSAQAPEIRFELSNTIRDTVLPELRKLLDGRHGPVRRGLQARVKDWASIFHSGPTWSALVRKNGVHKPRYRSEMSDLNQEVICLFKQELADIVQHLNKALKPIKAPVLQQGFENIDALKSALRNDITLSDFDLRTFYTNFSIRRADFQSTLDAFFDGAVDSIHQIAMAATSGEQDTPFNTAMQEAYQAAKSANLRGASRIVQRFELLHKNIQGGSGPAPLDRLQTHLRDEITRVMSTLHKHLVTALEMPFVNIKSDLEVRFGTRRALTMRDRSVRATLKVELAQILPDVWSQLDRAKECLDNAVWEAPASEAVSAPEELPTPEEMPGTGAEDVQRDDSVAGDQVPIKMEEESGPPIGVGPRPAAVVDATDEGD